MDDYPEEIIDLIEAVRNYHFKLAELKDVLPPLMDDYRKMIGALGRIEIKHYEKILYGDGSKAPPMGVIEMTKKKGKWHTPSIDIHTGRIQRGDNGKDNEKRV